MTSRKGNLRVSLTLLFTLMLLGFGSTKPPALLELTNLTCITLDTSIVKDLSCLLDRQRRPPSFSASLHLVRIIRAFTLHISIDIVRTDNVKFNLAKVKFDGCRFLSSLNTTSMFSKYLQRLQSASNIPRSCPIPANHRIAISNFSLPKDLIPPGIVNLRFNTNLKFLRAGRLISHIYVEGTVYY